MSVLTDWLTAIGTVGAAVASARAAQIAAGAALTWRDGLKYQRADECLAALEECKAAIGKTIDLKSQNYPPLGDAYSDVWEAWRKAKVSFVVAARYFPCMRPDFHAGDAIIRRLGAFRQEPYDLAEGERINSDFGQIVAEVSAALRE